MVLGPVLMSFTKRQKTLSAVLGLGRLALVADRMILRPQGGPSAASADSLQSANEAMLLSSGVPAPENAPGQSGVADRLNKLLSGEDVDIDQMRDPFSLPESWFNNTAPGDERAADKTGGFARRHQLRAVVVQGGESYALLADDVVGPGQSVDGFTLVSVGDRSVVLEREGKQVVREL